MKVKIKSVPKEGTKKVKISGLPSHQAGGNIPVTHGLPDGLEQFANIEAEGGEVYQDGNVVSTRSAIRQTHMKQVAFR